MEVVVKNGCGLDVHKRTVVACVRWIDGNGKLHKETRTFGTTTQELLKLSDWLSEREVTHVAMESTGVYWRPVYNILEGQFDILVVNAAHIKNVPGRKTDVTDAEWIADLLAVGLLRGSCIPDRNTRELRELVRYRKSLVRDRTAEVNRVQKVLEGANIKLSDVATDIMGKSGRAILEQLRMGEESAEVLANLSKGRLRNKREELTQALEGRIGNHQRFMLKQLLGHIDYLNETIARVEAEIEERQRPFEEKIERLKTVPGVQERQARALAAELPDLSRFATAKHLASWAGLSPGNNESAGKRKSGKITHGNPVLRETLIETAWAAVRSKNTYLSSIYRRLVPRLGPKKAIVAVAHSILISIYHMLTQGQDYIDLGAAYFDERHHERTKKRLIRRLEALGYYVTVEAIAPAA
jgi:transposase